MVKSKPSMTATSRPTGGDVLDAVDESIMELKARVDQVVNRVKSQLWDAYSGRGREVDEELRRLLDDYEPSVTESEIGELLYGDTNSRYSEVMQPLRDALPEGEDEDSFYIAWSGLRRMTEERRRQVAARVASGLGA